jgi:quercetin dioxygenase-like cupin family protein
MKTMRMVAAAALLAGSGVAMHMASAQAPDIKRTDLQRHDLSIPGREAIQALVEIGPGQVAPRHSHPGEEIIYVVEGVFAYQLDGEPPQIVKAGEVLFVPAGVIHAARNIGSGRAMELATYVVGKGKPLLVPAE